MLDDLSLIKQSKNIENFNISIQLSKELQTALLRANNLRHFSLSLVQWCVTETQWEHGLMEASYWRRCDVIASHRRLCGVFMAPSPSTDCPFFIFFTVCLLHFFVFTAYCTFYYCLLYFLQLAAFFIYSSVFLFLLTAGIFFHVLLMLFHVFFCLFMFVCLFEDAAKRGYR